MTEPRGSISYEIWQRSERRVESDRIAISLIIPTLQEERALSMLVPFLSDDLLRHYRIEVIISDGGSTDRTLELARQCADVVVAFRGAHRQTIAQGRNQGAAYASGGVLVFLNADTIPADAERFWQTIAQWATGKGPYASFAALAAPVEVLPSERRLSDVLVHKAFNTYLHTATRIGCGMGRGECHVVQRWLFERIGGYNAALAAGEDFEFLHRARRWTSIALPPELLVYESPRRYRRWGYHRILWRWFINWIGALLLRRSISSQWEPVRQ